MEIRLLSFSCVCFFRLIMKNMGKLCLWLKHMASILILYIKDSGGSRLLMLLQFKTTWWVWFFVTFRLIRMAALALQKLSS